MATEDIDIKEEEGERKKKGEGVGGSGEFCFVSDLSQGLYYYTYIVVISVQKRFVARLFSIFKRLNLSLCQIFHVSIKVFLIVENPTVTVKCRTAIQALVV